MTFPIEFYRRFVVVEQAERGTLLQSLGEPERQHLDITDKQPRLSAGRDADLQKPHQEAMKPVPMDLFEPVLAGAPEVSCGRVEGRGNGKCGSRQERKDNGTYNGKAS